MGYILYYRDLSLTLHMRRNWPENLSFFVRFQDETDISVVTPDGWTIEK